MNFFKKKPVDPTSPVNVKVETLIGRKTTIKGDVVFDKAIRIDGIVTGNVIEDDEGSSDSSIVIGSLGFVAGDLKASFVRIEGNLRGNIIGNTVHLARGAVVNGDISYDTISITPGAVIKGKLVQWGAQGSETNSEDAPVYGNGTGTGFPSEVVSPADAEDMKLPQYPNSSYVKTPI